MTCEECRDLQTHEFRSPADLLNALQVAAAEVERGALCTIQARELTAQEREALDSALAAEALPNVMRYQFKCTVCGDHFELCADTLHGSGGWTRREKIDVL